LSTFEINPISQTATVKPAANPIAVTSEAPVAANTTTETEEKEDNGEGYIRISYSALRYFAAACLLAALFMLFPATVENSNSYRMLKSKLDSNFIFNILPKDTKMSDITELQKAGATTDSKVSEVKHNGDKAFTVGNKALTASDKILNANDKALNANDNKPLSTANKAQTASGRTQAETDTKATTASDKASVAAKPAVTTPASYYTIVLASKVSYKNANAFVAQLHKDGYNAAKVLSAGRYAKVIYKQYTTKDEANKELNKITDNAELADAWVTKIKPQL